MENIINTPIPEIPIIVEKPKTNYTGLILIFFAFVLFLTGAYYLGKQSTVTSEISVVPTKAPIGFLPQTTAIPTVIVDPTTSWKTYTNTKLSFTIKHPNDWKVTDNQDSVGMDSPQTIESRKQYPTASPFDIIIFTLTEDKLPNNTSKLSLDQWIKSSTAKEYGLQNTASQITIDGNSGYKGEFCGEFCATEIFIKKNNVIYNIHLNSENIPEIYTQILSTFKFTENKDNLIVLQNKLNQYLSANLSFVNEQDGKTINLSDYYNPEFAKYGNKTDLIKKALADSGFAYDKSLDKIVITTWSSTYKSSTNTCILNGSEENLSLVCN